MENRNGLVVDVVLSQATGTAETEAASDFVEVNLDCVNEASLYIALVLQTVGIPA